MKLRSVLALAVVLVGFSVRIQADEKPKVDEAELMKSLKAADAVFTAEIGSAKPVAQTNSIPPSIIGEITFKSVKALRGKSEEKVYRYGYREGSVKNLEFGEKGRVIVVVKEKGVLAIIQATEANLALVRKADEPKK